MARRSGTQGDGGHGKWRWAQAAPAAGLRDGASLRPASPVRLLGRGMEAMATPPSLPAVSGASWWPQSFPTGSKGASSSGGRQHAHAAAASRARTQQQLAQHHPQKLTNHPSAADHDAKNKDARQLRVQQLRKIMLDLLVHASTCRSRSCQFPNCLKVKELFLHAKECKRRASGGCALRKKVWYMIRLHAQACRDSGCSMPRCRDLKDHLRRLHQQSESRRGLLLTK
ncbi:histone acetyltransferase HAC1 isoform X2 [Triticum aestivum]|uniref:histone acetyltransferase HAC1 isoform X2 n=1 Tax=Triticum aestivum TaxID=4565 RepID=UPI001D02BF0F|nr:histone acetyltransferase HAC1-like isoform X2 [Triticum aestivum]